MLQNPQSGLKCTPFKLKGRMASRAADTELVPLTAYLLKIATLPDFTVLDHSQWRRALS